MIKLANLRGYLYLKHPFGNHMVKRFTHMTRFSIEVTVISG